MKKFILLLLFIPINAYACCEMQGGFTGTYNEEGYAICMDETISYEKECMKPNINKEIYGCMDKSAKNYNKNATKNDNSCVYYVYGCTDKEAFNYNVEAEIDDGSCTPKVYGCTDKFAQNYNKDANIDDGSCRIITEIEKIVNIPYKTVYKKDDNMDLYSEKIIKEGKLGKKKIVYKVSLDSKGKELDKIKLNEVVLENPQDKIILVGIENSMKNFTILLYLVSTIIYIFNYLYTKISKNKNKYILKEIKNKNKYLNIIYNFIYILIIFPVYIDFIWIVKSQIDKNM